MMAHRFSKFHQRSTLGDYPVPYRRDIDGLRALAVLAVVIFHAWPALLPGGFVGVDIFFVISGYLISLIILTSLKARKFSLFNFYSHRIRRIFPALLSVLLVLLASGWILLLADEYRQLGKHVAAGAWFVPNIIFWRESGYFDVQSELKPLLHLWSLGVEEQYYILWPLILIAMWRRGWSLLTLIMFLWVGSFILNVWLTDTHATGAFYLPFGRAWELLMGGVLAWGQQLGVLQQVVHRHENRSNLISLLGFLLIFWGLNFIDKTQAFPGWRAAIPVAGAMLIIAAGPGAWFNRALFSANPMVAVGVISYPLYLWHWPMLSYMRILDGRTPTPGAAVIAVLGAVALAVLTYFFIERPIRRMPAEKCASVLIVLMGLVASVGGWVMLNNGFPFRHKDFQEVTERIKWAKESEVVCAAALPVYSRYCRISDFQRQPTAVIIGDSHANRLFEGLSPRFLSAHGNLLQLGEAGCLPFWRLEGGAVGESDMCSRHIDAQLDFVVTQPNIKTVILTGRGPLYISGQGFGEVEKQTRTFLRRPGSRASLSNRDLYAEAMRDTVERLLAANKKVIFIIDNPELGFNPLSCIKSRPIQLTSHARSPCAIPKEVVDERNKEYRSIVSEISSRFPSLIVVDTHRFLCDRQYCWALKDGDLLYMDGDHLSRAGALYISQYFDDDIFIP